MSEIHSVPDAPDKCLTCTMSFYPLVFSDEDSVALFYKVEETEADQH